MKSAMWFMVAMLFSAGCGSSFGDTGNSGDICAQYCKAESQAPCPKQTVTSCETFCKDLKAENTCTDEWNALLSCAVNKGFTCTPDGYPEPSDKECVEESKNLNNCPQL
jgi:hypothetical protein